MSTRTARFGNVLDHGMKERVGWLVSFLYCRCLLTVPDISNFVNQASGPTLMYVLRTYARFRLWTTTWQDWFSRNFLDLYRQTGHLVTTFWPPHFEASPERAR
jgi:hypothetical protein